MITIYILSYLILRNDIIIGVAIRIVSLSNQAIVILLRTLNCRGAIFRLRRYITRRSTQTVLLLSISILLTCIFLHRRFYH